MSRRLVPLLLVALCAAGCVPVTEPVGDIDKAAPDKELVGKWSVTDSSGTTKVVDLRAITVDIPAVKGNPKGLMRAKTTLNENESDMWFFLSTVGKESYATLILTSGKDRVPPDFTKEGEFAKWQKDDKKVFFVLRVARKGDELTLDAGNYDAVGQVMKDAKIPDDGDKHLPSFLTPAGWLAKYLDKNGPAKLFDKTNDAVLKREK